MPHEPFRLLFTDPIDTSVDELMVEEMYWSHMARRPLHILNQSVLVTNIYGEPTGEPQYVTVDPPIPIHIKLELEVEELDKYGYDRSRDALASFSSKILRDRALNPKVGDRIDFNFTNEAGTKIVEQFEILEISPVDFARQTSVPYHVVVAMDRTHKAKKP